MSTIDPKDIAHGIDQTAQDYAANVKLESGKEHIGQAARELKEGAMDLKQGAMLKAGEVKSAALHQAEHVKRRVESSVRDARGQCERYTREEPMKSLLYAFGIGFVLGLFLRR